MKWTWAVCLKSSEPKQKLCVKNSPIQIIIYRFSRNLSKQHYLAFLNLNTSETSEEYQLFSLLFYFMEKPTGLGEYILRWIIISTPLNLSHTFFMKRVWCTDFRKRFCAQRHDCVIVDKNPQSALLEIFKCFQMAVNCNVPLWSAVLKAFVPVRYE